MDARWLKFQSEYTIEEHAMSINDAVNRGNRSLDRVAHGVEEQTETIERGNRAISEGMWATEAALYGVQDEIAGLRDDVRNGFMGMAKLFDWGISRICWEHEQDRAVYRELLDVLKHPLRTQAEEHWELACSDMDNKRWSEAVDELKETTTDARRHYLAHFHLGHVLFFRLGLSDPAIEHFELAARYADEVQASDTQRYWAALAYTHMALLYRLWAETSDFERHQWLEKAQTAAARALQLVPALAPAVHEAVLVRLLLEDDAGATDVMETTVRQDEELLVGLERNPQLTSYTPVSEFIRSWHRRGADAERRIDALTSLLSGIAGEVLPSAPARAMVEHASALPACALQRGLGCLQETHSAIAAFDEKRLNDAVAEERSRKSSLSAAQAKARTCHDQLAAADARRIELAYWGPGWVGFWIGVLGFLVTMAIVGISVKSVEEAGYDPPSAGQFVLNKPAYIRWSSGRYIYVDGMAQRDTDGLINYPPVNDATAADIATSLETAVTGVEYRSLHWRIPDKAAFVQHFIELVVYRDQNSRINYALENTKATALVHWRRGYASPPEKGHMIWTTGLAAFPFVWAGAALVLLLGDARIKRRAKEEVVRKARLEAGSAATALSIAEEKHRQASASLESMTRASGALRRELDEIRRATESVEAEVSRMYDPA